MLLFSNQAAELFNQRYLKRKYIYPILIFYMQIDIQITIKKTNRKSFHVRYNNSKGMQKLTKTRNGKNQIFQKLYQWPLISFGFWIFWISVLKNLLALTLRLQWPRLYIFDIQFYPANCQLFSTSFLKFMCP